MKLSANILALAVAVFCTSAPSGLRAETTPQPTLLDISNWLNGIQTLEADFQQYNHDGSIDTGTLYVKRPGKLRMEYDKQNALVLASAGSIGVFDSKSDKTPSQYPLQSTPLWHILRQDVDLARPGSIKVFGVPEDLTRITAYDLDHPEAGRMVFEFDNSDGTIKLDGWKVRTNSGATVDVRLRKPEYGIPLSNSLFSIVDEQKRRNPSIGRD